jgi:hypothetical protein
MLQRNMKNVESSPSKINFSNPSESTTAIVRVNQIAKQNAIQNVSSHRMDLPFTRHVSQGSRDVKEMEKMPRAPIPEALPSR